MREPNTDDLRQELMTAPDLDQFIEKNEAYFIEGTMAQFLLELLQKKNMSKSALAKRANISEIYLHQVFAGQRNLSRNRLLCVCFGLAATLGETQELLKHCGFAQLYTRNRRDAIILYGLSHAMSLHEVNDELLARQEELLF